MRKSFLLLAVFTVSLLSSAQQTETTDLKSDEAAVKNLIERFLIAVGNYDIESLPEMFCEKANIGGVSFRNEQWHTFTMTIAEFLERLASENNPKKFTEPVSKFTVHIDGGMLAFVKADAILIRDGKPQSNNFDYFTLIKANGDWKILNGSYVSIPIDKQ